MAWLASAFSSIRARCSKKVRRWDLMMDESGSWLTMRRMYIRLVNYLSFRSVKHYRVYKYPVQMEVWSAAACNICCENASLCIF